MSCNSDDENSKKEAIAGKDEEANLETDLKSLQLKGKTGEFQVSETDEGITATPNDPYEDGNMSSLIDLRSKQSKSENVSSYKELHDTFRGTTIDNIFGVGRSNWRDAARTPCPRETKQHNSAFQATSWRDPNFKYERSDSSRRRREDDPNVSYRDGRSNVSYRDERGNVSYRDDRSNVPYRDDRGNVSYRDTRRSSRDNRTGSFDEVDADRNRERSKMGNWTLTCAKDIKLDNGLTEAEHVWICVNELYEQNRELFASVRPSEFESLRDGVKINCYTYNYKDKARVAKVADMLIEKIGNYPYCFYYFLDIKPMYMRTCEGELYECTENNNWRLIDFDEK